MGNYLFFLDTGEKRSKYPLLCKFCKIIIQNERVKLKHGPPNNHMESARLTRIREKYSYLILSRGLLAWLAKISHQSWITGPGNETAFLFIRERTQRRLK
jgi:hypothetical protein